MMTYKYGTGQVGLCIKLLICSEQIQCDIGDCKMVKSNFLLKAAILGIS